MSGLRNRRGGARGKRDDLYEYRTWPRHDRVITSSVAYPLESPTLHYLDRILGA
jgi:hypothetical protein